MNNEEVIKLTKELKNKLLELPEVKEYFKLKELFESSEELKEMRKNLILLEKEGKKEEKENLLKIYESHPLVNNYEIAKEEVKNLLSEIQKILSD